MQFIESLTSETISKEEAMAHARKLLTNKAEHFLKNHFYKNMKWVVEPGKFEIWIGSSSTDIRLKKTFDIR